MSLTGSQLGRYRLLKLVGGGGMGEVYLAQDTIIDRQVAIKVIRAQFSTQGDGSPTPEAVRLFKREAQAIAKLDHPHILPLFDFDTDAVAGVSYTYMVMPFRSEGTLRDWAQRRPSHILPPEEVAFFLQQAASALQYAHNHQIIHQDVKPSNFLLRESQERPALPDILLADFGIAKSTAAISTASSVHQSRGTPSYMAPEQWQGQPVPASDQYALAIMAYELLTGALPFEGGWTRIMYAHLRTLPPPPSASNPRLSPAIDSVILRALAKSPTDRFPMIRDFAHAFREAVGVPAQSDTSHPSVALSSSSARNTSPSSATTVSQSMPESVPMSAQEVPDHKRPSDGTDPQTPSHNTPAWERQTAPPPSFDPTQPPGDLSGRSQEMASLTIATGSQGSARPARQPIARIWLLVGLAVLLVLAGSLGTLLFVNVWGPGQHLQSTPTQQPAQATTTIPANPQVATAQALHNAALATRNPYDPHDEKLVMNDPLSAQSKYKWDDSSDDLGGCSFTGQAYHASVLVAAIAMCITTFTQLKDFTFQIEMHLIKGLSGGVLIRALPNQTSFYYCYIDLDGSYGILLYTPANSSPTKTLSSGSSTAVHTRAGDTNLLGVVMHGDTLEFYVNLQSVAKVQDTTHKQGYIGVAARSYLDPAEAIFTNARVWTAA